MKSYWLALILVSPIWIKAQIPTVKIAFQGTSNHFYNETLIGFPNDGTDGVDPLYDATKLFGNRDLQIFTYIGTQRYAIQGVPPVSTLTKIRLGYITGEASEYEVEIIESSLSGDLHIYIADIETNDLVDLTDSSYTFTSDIRSNPSERFVIWITKSGLDEFAIWEDNEWLYGRLPATFPSLYLRSKFTHTTGTLVCDNLVIQNDTLTVDSGAVEVKNVLTNNSSVIVKSGATLLTYDTGRLEGNSIELYRKTRYGDGKYSFVGSPMQYDTTVRGTQLGKFVFEYDETVDFSLNEGFYRWLDASDQVLIPGKGYTQAFQRDLVFHGKPNVGTISVSGTYTSSHAAEDVGWFLVSNPYCAAINTSTFLSDNNLSAVYFWDDNDSNKTRGKSSDYIAAGPLGTIINSRAANANRYNGHIGSCQGFFVQLSDSVNTTVTFNESQRVTGSNEDNTFFRKWNANSLESIKISASSGKGGYGETIIGFAIDATTGIDHRYDALAMDRGRGQLFSWLDNKPMIMQALPKGKDQYEIFLHVDMSNILSLKVLELKGLEEYMISLEDLNGRSYKFGESSLAVLEDGVKEFKLILEKKTLVQEAELVTDVEEKLLKIEQHDKRALVFDALGRQLFAGSYSDFQRLRLSTGFYFIHFLNIKDSIVLSQKILIK